MQSCAFPAGPIPLAAFWPLFGWATLPIMAVLSFLLVRPPA